MECANHTHDLYAFEHGISGAGSFEAEHMIWFPTYLMEHLGLPPIRAGVYSRSRISPVMAAQFFCEIVSDSISRAYSAGAVAGFVIALSIWELSFFRSDVNRAP